MRRGSVRTGLVAPVLLLALGCSEPAATSAPPPAGSECEQGAAVACYEGPEGTEQGVCHAGVRPCLDGFFGPCEGQVLPGAETCNGLDDDCDGEADEDGRNACGGCGELAGRVGAACGTCGTFACAGLDSVTCTEPPSCGGCGPETPGLGEPCTGDDGCPGTRACVGGTLSCDAAPRNECEVCGGPAVTGLGGPCSGGNSCPGLFVCDAAGTGTTCQAQQPNTCGVCSPPEQEPGRPCTDAAGCTGTWGCGTGMMVCNVDPASCQQPSTKVVFSELSTAGAGGAEDELIELFNPGTTSVDLGTWAIHYKSATGTTFTKRNLTGAIPARGFFLIARSTYVGTPAADLVQGSISLAARGGNVGLTDHQDPITSFEGCVDHVAWGTGDAPEGTAALAPAEGGSLERKATAASTPESLAAGGAEVLAGNGYDSDDNAADFVLQAVRSPQNAASPTE